MLNNQKSNLDNDKLYELQVTLGCLVYVINQFEITSLVSLLLFVWIEVQIL
jgi:hypothetical protein